MSINSGNSDGDCHLINFAFIAKLNFIYSKLKKKKTLHAQMDSSFMVRIPDLTHRSHLTHYEVKGSSVNVKTLVTEVDII